MSTTESEETEEVVEDEPALAPAADLDDLFADELDEDLTGEIEIPDDLSEDELRARLTAAEKARRFADQQRIAAARKAWVVEAKEHFPYSDPESIKGDSRRSFLEEAKRQDTAFRKRAEPILEKATKRDEDLRAEIRAELEEEAAKSFGRPVTNSGGSPAGEKIEETDKKIEKARGKRDLHGSVKAMMDGGRF